METALVLTTRCGNSRLLSLGGSFKGFKLLFYVSTRTGILALMFKHFYTTSTSYTPEHAPPALSQVSSVLLLYIVKVNKGTTYQQHTVLPHMLLKET